MKIQERNVQTLLSRQDLAQRWDLTTQAILNYEQQGIITRYPNIPTPRYSLEEIERIETNGMGINPLSPLERRRLEKHIHDLEKELEEAKTKLYKIHSIL